MCLRMIPSKRAGSRVHRAARALVAGVGLQLDPDAAERLEGVREHQQFRLDVDPGPPHRRVEPGPTDLDHAVVAPHVRGSGSTRPARRRRRGGPRMRRSHPGSPPRARRSPRSRRTRRRSTRGSCSGGRARPRSRPACAASQRPSRCSSASGSSVTSEPSRVAVSGPWIPFTLAQPSLNPSRGQPT